MWRLRIQQDSGAVAVVVAVCLTALLGFAALAIDVGAVFVERRELQNGADAAALAIAQDCATDPGSAGCADPLTAHGTAQSYANANANDNVSTVPPPGAGGVQFPAGTQKVVVKVDTNDPTSADTSRLAHFFAPVIGIESTAVTAKGAAIWGAASMFGGGEADVPVSGSVCDFWPDAPEPVTPTQLDTYAATLPTVQELGAGGAITGGQVLSLHNVIPDQDACTVSPGFSTDGGDSAGDPNTMPAGFGYLKDDGNCGVLVLETLANGSFWAEHNPGTSPAAATCIKNAVGLAVNIPIFIEVDRDNKRYLLYAPAAFYITGARVTGGGAPAVPNGFTCPGGAQEWCIRGHWVRKMDAGGSVSPGGTSFGVDTFQMTLE